MAWLPSILSCLLATTLSVPLQPGQPGGAWSEEELDIVRDKVLKMMECQRDAAASCWRVPGLPDKFNTPVNEFSRDVLGVDVGPPRQYPDGTKKIMFPNFRKKGPKPSLLIQLAFHDCLKYANDTGGGPNGCDGCINWHGIGYRGPTIIEQLPRRRPDLVGAWPKFKETTNNKLQLSVRSLELIYTLTDWPPKSKVLPESLKESGKSRADLWQFAANIALEKTINITNTYCHTPYVPIKDSLRPTAEWMLRAIEGENTCEMRLEKPIPFRSGRIDCIPDEDPKVKWTPYPFEATRKEKHSSAYDTGANIIKNLKEDFNFTARETISLMALHGLSGGRNSEQFTKYKWIGGKFGSFSNVYYKYLNGKTFWRGNDDIFGGGYGELGYFIGDKEGNPVDGTAFIITCKAAWNDTESGAEKRKYGGPCQFRPTHPGCSIPTESDLQMRQACFKKKAEDGATLTDFVKNDLEGCEKAELMEKDGFFYQKGGPAMSQDESCKHMVLGFVLPYELGFVLNFTVENNFPRGCGALDGAWRLTGQKPDCNSQYCKGHPKSNRLYIGSPGYDGSPPCGANTFKLDNEEESSAEIVAKFAGSNDEWSKSFFDAWEKMQMNGYNKVDLVESPENGQLQIQLTN